MQTFHFDLSSKNIVPVLNVKQGDVGRKFKAVITDGGTTYSIPAGSQLSVWYSGPSGEGNYSAIGERSAFAVDENAVTVELIAQMLVNAGSGAMCLILAANDGTQLGLWNVIYAVEPVPGMSSKAAEDYYTALSELARQAINAAATFETDPSLSVVGKSADAAAVGEGLVTKAPAGYGLGESSGKYTADCNTAVLNGWYECDSATKNLPLHGNTALSYSSIHVIARGVRVWQRLFTYTPAGANTIVSQLVRASADRGATWSEWDCVNPAMVPGVEYRTTERWDGKTVWTVLVNCGTTAGGVNSIETNFVCNYIIGYRGRIGYSATPRLRGTHDDIYGSMLEVVNMSGKIGIVVRNGSGQGGATEVQVWYTKN